MNKRICMLFLLPVLGFWSTFLHAQTTGPLSVDNDALVPVQTYVALNAVHPTGGPSPFERIVLVGDTLYNNGPLVTHPGAGGAPDTSKLNPGENTIGFGHARSAGYRVADDFTVVGGDWQIDSVQFFAYQTGSTTTSTMNFVSLRIWDGPPGDPGSSVIWGDTSTNLLTSTRWARIYRSGSVFATNRPIMTDVVTVGTMLPGGTYWLDWNTGGTLTSGPWVPPVTVRGDTAEGNARQWNPDSLEWYPALDTGTPAYPVPVQKALPFVMYGTAFTYQKDIQLQSVSLTPPFPPLGSPVTVHATIRNNGSEGDPGWVKLTYKPSSAPADSGDGVSQTFAPAWTSHVASVTFTTTYTAAIARNFDICVRSFYPADEDPSNDSTFGSEYALPDTDFVMLGLAQVGGGIPMPFKPGTGRNREIPETAIGLPKGPVASSPSVNRSTMVEVPTGQLSGAGLGVYLGERPFDAAPDVITSPDGINPITLRSYVGNLGFTSPPYSVSWSVGGVSKPPVSRPGFASLGLDSADLSGFPLQRGTMTSTATATVPGDSFPSDNSISFLHTRVYPNPMTRIRYDDGNPSISTFVGWGTTPGYPAFTAGVRFTATEDMQVANVDGFYKTEGSADSIIVDIWAAGTTDSTCGARLYTEKFAGVNYLDATGNYFTLPLGEGAPAFAAGATFWVSITFPDTNIGYPMGAQNSGFTPGHSFYSGNRTDISISWARLVITAERAWLLRVVGIPVSPSISVSVAAGWNLISNPVMRAVNTDSVRQLFPSSNFPYVFAFNPSGGYEQTQTMPNGPGFWGKFPSSTANPITGLALDRDTVEVATGWNIVGSISSPVDTGAILGIPSGLRGSNWFGYAAGYATVPVLEPGQAYWVKANSAGRFVLANPPLGAAVGARDRGDVFEGMSSLVISDSRGGSQTLYFDVDEGGKRDQSMFVMPPAPPAGAFDARFESAEGGLLVQSVRQVSGTAAEFSVRIQSDASAVTVSWRVKRGDSFEINDGVGGAAFAPRVARGEGSLQIWGSGLRRFVVKAVGKEQLPAEYALMQNYPNPFNPTTSIKFKVPSSKVVTLKVFDVLGREVATLVNEVKQPGTLTVQWDASGVGSGVYFYRLKAGDFVQTKRMILLR